MAKYHHIRRKIKSVRSTRQITKAMELVAGSKLRRAQERLLATRPYQSRLQDIIRSLSAITELPDAPLLVGRPVKQRGLVVLASDRGLCGAYNVNLFRAAQRWIESEPTPVQVITVGRKARDYFRRQGVNLLETFPQPAQELSLVEIGPIASSILSAYQTGKVDSVHLVYARFRSALVNIPTVVKLIPIEAPAAEQVPPVNMLFEPQPALILAHLLPRVVLMELVGYLAESLTSEHGARMMAMQNATKNAQEMIDWLTLLVNRERQAAITQEILEVVSGAGGQ